MEKGYYKYFPVRVNKFSTKKKNIIEIVNMSLKKWSTIEEKIKILMFSLNK